MLVSENTVQAAMQVAEDAVTGLLAKVRSDPQLKADAERGVIRGPQLALVELQLRKLDLSGRRQKASTSPELHGQQEPQEAGEGQQREGQQKEGQQVERGKWATKDVTRSLAEAILSYYKQLGHMLSCAVDLR